MRALTIGGAMVDTVAIVDDVLIEQMAMQNVDKTFLLLEQGSKTEALSISTHCGGGAINAAVAFARLGFDVSVLAKCGDDERAETIRRHLTAEGIGTDGLRATNAAPTGASVIVAAHDRNAAVFTFRGANTHLTVGDLQQAAFEADAVYVSTLSGDTADTLPAIVERCREKGVQVTVNPGIRQIATRFEAICKLLPYIDILVLNRREAEAFVRQAVTELAGSENITLRRAAAASVAVAANAGQTSSDVARALLIGLVHLGAQTVLLTDGKSGAYVAHDQTVLFSPALIVEVVSSVGAGDAFASTFSAYFAESGDCELALRAATINAASVVGEIDSQSGLLTLAQLRVKLADSRYATELSRWNAQS